MDLIINNLDMLEDNSILDLISAITSKEDQGRKKEAEK